MVADTVISAPRVVGLADGGDGPGWVRVEGERIAGAGRGAAPRLADVALDGVLVPGLVDAQINGAYAVDFADADASQVREVAEKMLATGVTSMVPTFITAEVGDLVEQVVAYTDARHVSNGKGGATRLLGAHVEGPFLAPNRRGAHREHLLVDPTAQNIAPLVEIGELLSYVTFAPERTGGIDAVSAFRAAGVRVAVGHSDATDDVVRAAADAGATLVTHLYNAQRPLHHRDPGVVGAALSDPRLTCGLIADGHHVEPAAIRVAFAAARGRVMLVTDAVAALGMPPGTYELGGQDLVVAEGQPPLRADGAIAGADAPLDACIGTAVRAGIDLVEAVTAATRTPADALGRGDVGRLEPGAHADLALLGTDDLRTRETWLAGRRVWHHTEGTPA